METPEDLTTQPTDSAPEETADESSQELKTEALTSTKEEKQEDKPEEPPKNPHKIILTYMAVSMGFGIIPVPVLDIAAVTAVQMEMLRQLSKIYDANWNEITGRYFITSQAGVTLARLAAGAIKTIPGVGTVIGAAAQAILSGASTFAIGQVFIRHFGQEKGNFENFDPKEYKSYYKEQFKKGRKVAEEVGEEEAEKHEGESLETVELDAESMNNEAARNFLERSSESFVSFYQSRMEKIRNWRKKEVAPEDLEVESIPEDLNIDPEEIEAEMREEAEEAEGGSFFSRTSGKLWGYYQNWRAKEEEVAEDGDSEQQAPDPSEPLAAEDSPKVDFVDPEEVGEEEDDSWVERSQDKLKDIYDSSLGKGVKWVSKLRKRKGEAEETTEEAATDEITPEENE